MRGTADEDSLLASTPLKQSGALKKPKKKLVERRAPLPEYEPVTVGTLPGDSASEPVDASNQSADAADFGEPLNAAAASSALPDGRSSAEVTDADGKTPKPGLSVTEAPAPGRAGSGVDDEDPAAMKRAERDNLRETPVEGAMRKAETDPYSAPGITAGAFMLKPTLDTGLRWTSNSDSSANGKPALLSETTLRLRADSNWSRHRLGLEATGSWKKSVSGAETNDAALGLGADFQMDFSGSTVMSGAVSWNHMREAASAPAAVTGALTRPDVDKLAGSLGLSQEVGLVTARLKLNAERAMYGDAADALGAAVSQKDRDNTLLGVTLRAGFNLSEAVAPYVEAEAGRRIFDNEKDSFGLSRSASRYALRAGVEADFGDKLKADIAAGYLIEDIDDTSLEDIKGLSLSGTVTWSPMRGTNVALNAATSVEGSSTATSGGSLLHSVTATLNHKARENLDLTASVGASLRDYASPSSNEITLLAGAGFTYWFNRYAGLNARASHETVMSSDATRQSQTNSVYVGVTLRR